MFAVKTLYNTDADGSLVEDTVAEDDMPTTYAGPFDTLEEAVYWMNHVYPDGDTDVYDQFADDYDLPKGTWVNHPDSLFDASERGLVV